MNTNTNTNTNTYIYPSDTAEYFAQCGWDTPNQIRDRRLTSVEQEPELTTTRVSLLHKLALNETTRRKLLPELYIKCPRCYGYHEQLSNIDSLCELCEQHTAPFRFDSKIT